MLDLKLYTLLTVIEEKSFTAAAKKLSFTQPAVTQQINSLENEYGVKIFNRDKKQITLTKEGEIIANYAKKFKAMDDKLKEELKNINSSHICLKVGITHTEESNNLISAIGKFCIQNANISISIISDTTENLYEMIKNYELDFAVVARKNTDNYINSYPLDSDQIVCVLNPSHYLTTKKEVTLKDLSKEKLILRLNTSETRKLFDSYLQSISDSINNYNVILEVDNIATIKDLVRKDFGISILPKSACMDEVGKKKLVVLPIKNSNIEKHNYLIYNNYFRYPKIIEEFVNLYKKTYL